MKKLYMIVAAVFLLTGCDHTVKDLFDEDAGARNRATEAHILNLLTGSANGWMVEYYPNINQAFGGYTMVMKFDRNGNVDVWSEMADDVSVAIRSHYSIDSSNGPCVIFDTYNEYFHYFSSPATLWGAGAGIGYGGDYILIYRSGDESQIEFRGKKSENRILFKPIPDGLSEAAYLSAITSTGDFVSEHTGVRFVNGGESLEGDISGLYSIFTFDINDKTETLPFRYTEDGVAFYRELTFVGATFSKLVLDRTAKRLTDPESGFYVELSGKRLPFEAYAGDWNLYYTTGSTSTTYYNKPVQLVPGADGTFYTLTGLEYDIVLDFHKRGRMLTYLGQYIAPLDGNFVVSTAIANEGTYYSYSFNRGLISEWDGESSRITFRDNGMWSTTRLTTGFNFRLYNTKVPHVESDLDRLIANYYKIYLDKQ